MKLFALVAVLVTISSSNALAGRCDNVPSLAKQPFSEAEKSAHAQNIDVMAETAARCLDDMWEDHTSFYAAHKFSKYYGNRKYSKVKGERRADGTVLTWLGDALGTKVFNKYKDQFISSSCIDRARGCMRAGFAAAGQEDLWNRIDCESIRNGALGHILLNGLQRLGWKMLYWTPAGTRAEAIAYDKADVNDGASKAAYGNNKIRWDDVMKSNTYWGRGEHKLIVDDKKTLVGFGKNPPQKFLDVPFFLSIAHTGYHVFAGYHGNVIEGHSARPITSVNSIENNPFNPLGGGAPMSTDSEFYRNGVMVVPPGSL